MTGNITLLLGAAASIGLVHTILGPDHYLPFIMLSKAGQWSMRKTMVVTLLCGIGHVLSSVILGMTGIAFGIAVTRLEIVESFRGSLAAWLLIGIGLAYFIWGIKKAIQNKPHTHLHSHNDHPSHSHSHSHTGTHTHLHENKAEKKMTPWILFIIFAFSPCEPLIPLLMYPAAKSSIMGVFAVSVVFATATIVTMLIFVYVFSYGLSYVPFQKLERYSHAIAGFTILLCGGAIQFLGL
ncbi:MAG: sulfite exporter TauE/SafE family protein [Candidatus Marinimicrobia bacterium]|nr:sulfite exporter TauE/SafE family protein [bacterium]MCG2716591.1 sulfite exporter TauE/SafE family protein [Candidatus Neomarinimicrobiota bacterium]